jgi:hypothetical protein
MTEEYLIKKTITYLNKKKRKTKNKDELVELKQLVEELDSLNFKIKKWKEELKNGIR